MLQPWTLFGNLLFGLQSSKEKEIRSPEKEEFDSDI